ncbi:Ubiquinone biosynthesis monooxygenase COQ6, mitochondrial [Armadillidium nasatum]|uniref:Ubiquinone biosynthesis monooxygenase COQ6, mitochondrial n=1 Tax=Armadillidium nasatum TaxID=96803 RepID=A0A5N5T483_9CRUS|nr:Ubiquinone biosynthesis monooxygenase COQ6, mitochondrial [Armadillidium nasatum]
MNGPGVFPKSLAKRVSALNLHTKKPLTQLGAWNTITGLRSQPVKKMQVLESCTEGIISFEEEEKPEEPIL